MRGKALLLDVGNTRLKWGVLQDGDISRTGSITHATLKEAGFQPLTTRLPRDVDDVLVSNVAGAGFATRLAGVIGMHCGTDVHFARSEKQAFGIRNAYRQPRRLGVDRWVAMIGARAESKKSLCVVDVGTAMTIDVLDSDGRHLGGQIIPGVALMMRALDQETSDIGPPGKTKQKADAGLAMFADGTRRAVQSGALNAVCGAIERAVRAIRGAGFRPAIVLTGGDASRILAVLDGNPVHRPHLVLQGLAFMLQEKS